MATYVHSQDDALTAAGAMYATAIGQKGFTERCVRLTVELGPIQNAVGAETPTAREENAALTRPTMELARGLEPLTCCFSAAGIGGLWPGGIVWRLA